MAHIAEAEEPDRLLTRAEVARRLSLSVSGVKNLEKAQGTAVRVGGAVRWRESDVARLVERGTTGGA